MAHWIYIIRAVTLAVLGLLSQKILGATPEKSNAWLRVDTGLAHLSLSPLGDFIAYTPDQSPGLRVLNTKNGKVFEPTGYFVGASFFWSPDGGRLFYREMLPSGAGTKSLVKAWDVAQSKNIDIETFEGTSGFLTFDPSDHRMVLIHKSGIKSKKLVFPENRLAFWQASRTHHAEKWALAQNGAAVLSDDGLSLKRLADDKTGIESFNISPDGSMLAWSTRDGKIYYCERGHEPIFVDWGRDPNWHREKLVLLFSGGRMIGNKAADYDLKIFSPGSKSTFLTATQHQSERWPIWSKDGSKIIFTIQGSKELHVLDVESAISLNTSKYSKATQ